MIDLKNGFKNKGNVKLAAVAVPVSTIVPVIIDSVDKLNTPELEGTTP
jgi:hypothetical protein